MQYEKVTLALCTLDITKDTYIFLYVPLTRTTLLEREEFFFQRAR